MPPTSRPLGRGDEMNISTFFRVDFPSTLNELEIKERSKHELEDEDEEQRTEGQKVNVKGLHLSVQCEFLLSICFLIKFKHLPDRRDPSLSQIRVFLGKSTERNMSTI